MENSVGYDANFPLYSGDDDTLKQPSTTTTTTIYEGSQNLNIVDDLDSYFDHINGCLTVSRMVNDSVIKGMVNAVLEEALERESSLKQKLHLYESGEQHKFEDPLDILPKCIVIKDCLDNLRIETEKQFQFLKKRIEVKRKNSFLELQDRNGRIESKWLEDQTLSTLRNIVNNIVYSSKKSICEWEKEQEFRDEVEAMVIQNSVRSLLEEYEAKVSKQRAQLCGTQSTNLLGKIKELSSLIHELDAITKSLSSPEMGQLPSHGQHDGVDECITAKRKDPFRRSVLTSHISLPTNSFRELNAKDGESKGTAPETMEYAQLKHMPKEELISYFKSEMTKMKRNNESVVQEITEEYYSLKREFLKERGPSSLRKDKEFEALKKKIPQVMLKLEDILVENDKLPVVYESNEIICSLKGSIDTLLSENHQLKDLIANKTEEVTSLSPPETITLDVEDSDMESIMVQEISGIIFREAAKDAVHTVNLMKRKYEEEKEQRLSLETSLLKTKNALSLEIGDKEQFKKDILLLSTLMEEKEKAALELSVTLMEEKKQFGQIYQEFNRLKDEASQQERLNSVRCQELNLMTGRLEDALMKMHLHEEETGKLEQKLKLARQDLEVANQERIVLHEAIQKKESTLSLVESKEMEQRKQIESIIMCIQQLLKATSDFESQTMETIERNHKRLKLLKFQFEPHKALFRRTELAYKQRLDKSYSDLQKAEAEVDLLGDEVDALLSLLEKIYIALDHYSPVLQYYPGIMEILKLIKRELSGETTKSV